MLEPLLRSKSTERILIFLVAREDGHARDMARFFDADLYAIQKQLDNLEAGGVLTSRLVGRTRLYAFNPRYPFTGELKQLLLKTLSFYPEGEREKLMMNKRRPRRRDKPL